MLSRRMGAYCSSSVFEPISITTDSPMTGDTPCASLRTVIALIGGTLAFFDLVGRSYYGRFADYRLGDYYKFDSRSELLYLGYRDLGAFKYRFSSEFLDGESWERSQWNTETRFYYLFDCEGEDSVRSRGFVRGERRRDLQMLNVAFDRSLEYPYQQAAIQRTKGEVQ